MDGNVGLIERRYIHALTISPPVDFCILSDLNYGGLETTVREKMKERVRDRKDARPTVVYRWVPHGQMAIQYHSTVTRYFQPMVLVIDEE
jgi:hypothetical protein